MIIMILEEAETFKQGIVKNYLWNKSHNYSVHIKIKNLRKNLKVLGIHNEKELLPMNKKKASKSVENKQVWAECLK